MDKQLNRFHHFKFKANHINRYSGAMSYRLEKRLLIEIASRLPEWITPGHLTLVGIIAAATVCVAYLLTNYNYDWLWVANLGIFLHWFGDSLDGTVARVRKIERVQYGLFIDHSSDALSVLIICLGIGGSPLMILDIALLVIIAYYALMIITFLSSLTRNTFMLSFGVVGPTEVRACLVILNIAIWQFGNPLINIGRIGFTILDLVGLISSIAAFIACVTRGFSERKILSTIDPPRCPTNNTLNLDNVENSGIGCHSNSASVNCK